MIRYSPPIILSVFFFLLTGFSQDSMAKPIFNAQASFRWAPLDGFLQTPAGGTPGTADIKSPSFDDLDINSSPYYDLLLTMDWGNHTFYIGSQFIRFSESGILKKSFHSRRFFESGTHFTTDISFDWYRVGYSYRFENLGFIKLFAPKIEVALLDFNYELENSVRWIERDYSKPTLRAGFDALLMNSKSFDIMIEAETSVPLSNTPSISTLSSKFRYKLFKSQPIDEAHLYIGLGMLNIDYKDNQELPNHISLSAEPFFSIGMVIKK